MPPELNPEAGRPELFQSVEQWLDSDRFRELMRDEFPDDAAEWLDPVSRRKFLQLSGASLALAGAVGCNPSFKPAGQKKVVPYVKQPTEILPNVPLFFATAVAQAGGVGLGLLVKSAEGRPIKIEGNPNQPSSLGGTNVAAQGALLNLYDPDRSKENMYLGVSTTYTKTIEKIKEVLAKSQQGDGVRVLAAPTTSPTQLRLMGDFSTRFPKAKWTSYEPAGDENCRKGVENAFGKPLNPVYQFDKANVVLSLDCDFLSAAGPGGPRFARDFIARRKVRHGDAALKAKDGVDGHDMNRLYAVESMLTSTGGTADHRLPLKPSEIESFARAVAKELGVTAAEGKLPEFAAKWVKPLADDLKKNNGKALVVAGAQQPVAVHKLAWAINDKLGALGKTVTFTEPLSAPLAGGKAIPPGTLADLKALVADMQSGAVKLLLVANVNPVYDAPADLDFRKAVQDFKAKGGSVVHLGEYVDETGFEATYHVNAAHFLESWGDVRGHDGSVSVQQPLIAPLYDGKTTAELLAAILDSPQQDSMEMVRATWTKWFADSKQSGDFDLWWQHGVRDGVLAGAELKTVEAPKLGDKATDGLGQAPVVAAGMEIQFLPDPTVGDGRYANNGWLQEMPKPITSITWDNAAIVSPRTAEELKCGVYYPFTGGERGSSEVDVVELTLNGRKVLAAVFPLPSHADGVVTLHLGYGRTKGGKTIGDIANGLGSNAYALRASESQGHASGLEVKKTGQKFIIACTQGQYLMEGRRPHRSATVEQFEADHEFAQIPPASPGEYKELRALTPGTEEDWVRLYGTDPSAPKYPFHDDHAHAHAHEPHDKRVIPLSLYPTNPSTVKAPNGDPDEASKTYRRWGLAVDLGACTGCGTCVIACQAENNIPVVGKGQVMTGRAMHWIRIDRYFSIPGSKALDDELGDRSVGTKDRAERVKESHRIDAHFQPMMCHHCEKAPCEVVCPVQATAHSADGLNDMAYNRCVGTRYCANNCPYKVRRFNFLQYADYSTESLKLVNNPEVTVRTRGVMEKCTYCTQRIRNAEIETEREFMTRPKDMFGRPKIKDGEILSACQQACPTGAIVFGDLNDPESQVLRWKAEPTNYGVLAEQNTMPRTSYLAAIKNPNPAMPA